MSGSGSEVLTDNAMALAASNKSASSFFDEPKSAVLDDIYLFQSTVEGAAFDDVVEDEWGRL